MKLKKKLEKWTTQIIQHFQLNKSPYYPVVCTAKEKILNAAEKHPELTIKWLNYIKAQIEFILKDDTDKQ